MDQGVSKYEVGQQLPDIVQQTVLGFEDLCDELLVFPFERDISDDLQAGLPQFFLSIGEALNEPHVYFFL